MPARTALAVVAVTLAACVTPSKQFARMTEQLDAYEIQKPIAEAWPLALRFLDARGYALVGADRKWLGDEPQTWGAIFAKGHETWVQGKRWEAETAMNPRFERYRLRGTATGEKTCRIEFYSIVAEDPTRNSMGGGEPITRDVELELAFVSSLDPAGAERISRAVDTR